MTPDPIPQARESAAPSGNEKQPDGLIRPDWHGKADTFGNWFWNARTALWQPSVPEPLDAAALATPTGDDVANLRAELARKEEWNRLRAEDIVTLGRQVAAAEAQRDALQERVWVLEEALGPFAEPYPHRDEPDHWPAFGKRAGGGWPTVGAFRRARAALIPHQQGNGGDDA